MKLQQLIGKLNASRPVDVSIKYKTSRMNLSQQNINKPWLCSKLHALRVHLLKMYFLSWTLLLRLLPPATISHNPIPGLISSSPAISSLGYLSAEHSWLSLKSCFLPCVTFCLSILTSRLFTSFMIPCCLSRDSCSALPWLRSWLFAVCLKPGPVYASRFLICSWLYVLLSGYQTHACLTTLCSLLIKLHVESLFNILCFHCYVTYQYQLCHSLHGHLQLLFLGLMGE